MLNNPRRYRILAYGLALLSATSGPTLALAQTINPPVPHAPPIASIDGLAPEQSVEQKLSNYIESAEFARTSGDSLYAARQFAKAYQFTRTTADYRNSDIAEQTATEAAHAYHAAFIESAQNYALCEEAKRVLDTFIEEWAATGQPISPAILNEHRWLETTLSQAPPPPVVPPVVPSVPDPEVPADEAPHADADSGPAQLSRYKSFTSSVDRPPPPPDAAPQGLNIGLLSGGAVVMVAGGVLLGVGIPVNRQAEQYRATAFDSPEFTQRSATDQRMIREQFDRYVDDERQRGIVLISTGGALLGVGLTAIIVGVTRRATARRHVASTPRRTSPRALTSLDPTKATIGLSLDF